MENSSVPLELHVHEIDFSAVMAAPLHCMIIVLQDITAVTVIFSSQTLKLI
jgi:hypothetical protein